VAGGITVLVDVAGYLILKPVAGPILAAVLGFSASVVVNFVLHSKWTFLSVTDSQVFLRYATVIGIGLVLNSIFVALADHWVGNPDWGKGLFVMLWLGVGYALSKYWVFRKSRTQGAKDSRLKPPGGPRTFDRN